MPFSKEIRKVLKQLYMQWVEAWYKKNLTTGRMVGALKGQLKNEFLRFGSAGGGFFANLNLPILSALKRRRELWNKYRLEALNGLRKLVFEHRSVVLTQWNMRLLASCVFAHTFLIGNPFFERVSKKKVVWKSAEHSWRDILCGWEKFVGVLSVAQGLPEMSGIVRSVLSRLVQEEDTEEGEVVFDFEPFDDCKTAADVDKESVHCILFGNVDPPDESKEEVLFRFLQGDFRDLESAFLQAQLTARVLQHVTTQNAFVSREVLQSEVFSSVKVVVDSKMKHFPLRMRSRVASRLQHPKMFSGCTDVVFVECHVSLGTDRGSNILVELPLSVFNALFCQETSVTKCLQKSMRRHDITGQQQRFEQPRRGEPLRETRLGNKYPERWLRDRIAKHMFAQL